MALRGERLRGLRKNLQMMFQDPYAALNPRMTVGEAITEPMLAHRMYTPADAVDRACEILEAVGLEPGVLLPLPARVQRGPETAHQHGALARGLP